MKLHVWEVFSRCVALFSPCTLKEIFLLYYLEIKKKNVRPSQDMHLQEKKTNLLLNQLNNL